MPDIRLVEMSDEVYEVYIARCLATYVEEGARATSMDLEAATEFGRRQFEGLLPDGRCTDGQHFRQLVLPSGEPIGDLWFAAELEHSPPRLFLYDIVILDSLRGRGHGSAAMRAVEVEARRLGAEEVALHVFTHNEGAIRLYERLGYETTVRGEGGRGMRKHL